MSRIVIDGGNRLAGSVLIQGSKNSALPVMAASILNKVITILKNCPDIADVRAMISILEYLGAVVNFDEDELIIDSKHMSSKPIPGSITGTLRASSLLMGPLLARYGKVDIAYPGGCDIGKRPLDIHLNAFKLLGASWELGGEFIKIFANHIHGNYITLRFPSVGATQNIIMAAVGAKGRTIIYNAAIEPEVKALCSYLAGIGVDITIVGKRVIISPDECELSGETIYDVPSDRIAAGTYMAAVATCGGDIELSNINMNDCIGFLDVYVGMGLNIRQNQHGLVISSKGEGSNVNYIKTGPYPEFPTDMQSVTMAVAATFLGNLTIVENVFESRYRTANQLVLMGADIKIEGKEAAVKGVNKLLGSEVSGSDLRGTAALAVAGLSADGRTIIYNADHIERGYVDFCKNLSELGADIEWEKD